MKSRLIISAAMLAVALAAGAQKVTVNAVNQPAATVFRSLIEQTGKNFVYSSDLLQGVNVTVAANNRPLKKVLAEMFADTDVSFKIKGNNVVLKRKKGATKVKTYVSEPTYYVAPSSALDTTLLKEVVVVSRLDQPELHTAEISASKVTAEKVRNTPTLLGEPDVIKALQMQPGVVDGTEGLAGMYVHGGNADENLYMLDNIPIYHVNHFAGLFSAFNTDIIRYIDFFKSSMPAKYDGRLSSFMDVRLQNGIEHGHHGSARIGLTSGAFNISGPIGKRTTYLVGIRRSWYDVLSAPILAIANSSTDEKTRFHYYFMDLNGKVTHRFSNRATGFISIYFGDDLLHTGYKDRGFDSDYSQFIGSVENDSYNFHWGNLVVQTGLNYRVTTNMSAEFTAAYTRYFSDMKQECQYKDSDGSTISMTQEWLKSNNNINDWIFRGDFNWQPSDNSTVRFGANYVRHSFLPSRTSRTMIVDDLRRESTDSTTSYHANELNAYIEDDWQVTSNLRLNAGIHTSLFYIDKDLKHGLSPRLSASYRINDNFALKGAYSRTTQYVHQLTQSYLCLPTDQWIPVTGSFKPQTADKVAAGVYWLSTDNNWAASAEGYYKWMHNLVDYCDEYYLKPPLEMWNARLTTGRGTAKGIDFKFEKLSGKFTGHISYSLAWADRTFAEKNFGHTYPARFDNRHTINILINWNISKRVQLNASWTGHSGNRYTLLSQQWEIPSIDGLNSFYNENVPLREPLNSYQLPFYHRLDLTLNVRNSRGFWTFGLYNAYNHKNVVAIRRATRESYVWTPEGVSMESRPVFQKVSLLPIIPTVSYTWQFYKNSQYFLPRCCFRGAIRILFPKSTVSLFCASTVSSPQANPSRCRFPIPGCTPMWRLPTTTKSLMPS